MSTNDGESLKRQRERRKRIARMKVSIVGGIFLLLVLLLVCCIVLAVKVFSLQHKINELYEQVNIMAMEAGATQEVVEDEPALSANSKDADTESDAAADTQADTQADTADAGPVIYGENAHQEIYLTFDDGPSDNTEAILEILEKHGVKATFFVVGKEDGQSLAMYKKIVDEGHTLGMHSYSHKYSELYASLDAFKADIQKEQDLLYEATGQKPWLFRFPGGSSNLVSDTDMSQLISYLNEEDITYFDWNISCGDATSQAYTTQELIDNVMADIGKYKTAVILMHDANNKTITVEALDELLTQLEQRDAQIKPIDKDTNLVQHVKADSVNDNTTEGTE